MGTAGRAPARDGHDHWRYRAENVRDFAWAASTAFILDGARRASRSTTATTSMSSPGAYPAEGVSADPTSRAGSEATEFGRHTHPLLLRDWYPYPYPVAISVGRHRGRDGVPDDPVLERGARGTSSLFGVIDHELGHNWFPMIVGSDERRQAWMDEGFNTFMNSGSNLAFYDEGCGPGQPGYGTGEQTSWYALTPRR